MFGSARCSRVTCNPTKPQSPIHQQRQPAAIEGVVAALAPPILPLLLVFPRASLAQCSILTSTSSPRLSPLVAGQAAAPPAQGDRTRAAAGVLPAADGVAGRARLPRVALPVHGIIWRQERRAERLVAARAVPRPCHGAGAGCIRLSVRHGEPIHQLINWSIDAMD